MENEIADQKLREALEILGGILQSAENKEDATRIKNIIVVALEGVINITFI